MEHAYAAIGRAVIAMQLFEVTFVSIHEGFKMVNDDAYRQATGGIITLRKYKEATANVVKKLKEEGNIAENLETRINTLIEKRHQLMHRWFLQHGWPWPDTNKLEDYALVIELADYIRVEANALTHMMAGYMVKHADPASVEKDPEAYRRAMAELFHKMDG